MSAKGVRSTSRRPQSFVRGFGHRDCQANRRVCNLCSDGNVARLRERAEVRRQTLLCPSPRRACRCTRCNAPFPGSNLAANPNARRPRSAAPRDHRHGRASSAGRRTPARGPGSAATGPRRGPAPRVHDPPVPARERRCRSRRTAATAPMNPASHHKGSSVGVRREVLTSPCWVIRYGGQDTGCRMQGTGCRMQGTGCRMQGTGCRMQDAGYRVQDA